MDKVVLEGMVDMKYMADGQNGYGKQHEDGGQLRHGDSTEKSWLLEVVSWHFRIDKVDLIDEVYLLKKMDQDRTKKGHTWT